MLCSQFQNCKDREFTFKYFCFESLRQLLNKAYKISFGVLIKLTSKLENYKEMSVANPINFILVINVTCMVKNVNIVSDFTFQ